VGEPDAQAADTFGRKADHDGSSSTGAGKLEAIEQQQDPIFASAHDVFLELVLAGHELETAAARMRKAWWP
jgi:hypothetical protein